MMKLLRNILFLTIGGCLAALAIEGFLVPNKIIDGGILGIAMMAAYIVKTHVGLAVSLGAFTFLFNVPFIFFALKKFGKRFVFSTFYAVAIMSLTIFFVEHWDAFSRATGQPFLATIFGGAILGLGVGLVLRNNGCLDGTEVMAIAIMKKTGFSVGEIVMFFNVFIFAAAGFVYAWDSAMYSIVTYFVASKVIDAVIEGPQDSKSAWIITDFAEEIGQKIMNQLDISVTYIDARGGYSGNAKKVVYCVTSRLELVKLKEIVKEIDPSAFIAIENVHEVEGTRVKSKKAKFH